MFFPVDNQIEEAEKEAKAAQEKVERLKQAKIQSAKDSLAKGLSLLKAAKGNFSQTQMWQVWWDFPLWLNFTYFIAMQNKCSWTITITYTY